MTSVHDRATSHKARAVSAAERALLGVLCAAIAVILGRVVLGTPADSAGLGTLVEAHLNESGVTNPVTAVLLNFRGYDTLLEVGVLLVAVLGVWLVRDQEPQGRHPPSDGTSPVLIGLVRVLVPPMIVIGGYLTWIGATEPGGAFQGGAVIGGAWVLLLCAGWRLPTRYRGWPQRGVLIAGFAVFLCVAVAVMIDGRLLEYPQPWAGGLILLIESVLLISLSAVLASLLTGKPDAR